MIEIELNKMSKAVYWDSELPDIKSKQHNILKKTYIINQTVNYEKEVALELYIPQGAKISYGLLGCKFKPNDKNELIVSLCIQDNSKIEYAKSLAKNIDTVYIGLPNEYSGAIIKTIEENQNIISSGELIFDYAAHGLVSSNNKIFSIITKSLLELIFLKNDIDSKDKLKEVILNNLNF